jgi:hypothetical protein
MAELWSSELAEKFGTWNLAFSNFGKTIGRVQESRRSILTRSKLLGLGPLSTVAGDEVWLIHEGRVPYVLRPQGKGEYTLMGETYIHGCMRGELVNRLDASQFQRISIV